MLVEFSTVWRRTLSRIIGTPSLGRVANKLVLLLLLLLLRHASLILMPYLRADKLLRTGVNESRTVRGDAKMPMQSSTHRQ